MINMMASLPKQLKRNSWLTFLVQKLMRRQFTRSFGAIPRLHAGNQYSALFVSDLDTQHSAPVSLDLDIGKQLACREALLRNLNLRRISVDVDNLAAMYDQLLHLEDEKRKLEEEKQHIAGLMAAIKRAQNPENKQSEEILIARGKSLRENLKSIMNEWYSLKEQVTLAGLALPNVLHEQTPEKTQKILKQNFQDRETGPSKDHIDIARRFNLIKFSSVGPRSFYLLGQLARLELDIINFFHNYWRAQGFVQITCPTMVRSPVVEACGVSLQSPNEIYTLQQRASEGKDELAHLHLRGTSLLSFAAYLARMRISPKSLPLKLFSCGRQFTPESPLPGLFGATQTTQVSICGGCQDEVSSNLLFEDFMNRLWELYLQLGMPVQLVLVPASELQIAESLRAEVQLWAPSLQQYIKIASVSICSDFVSRRLMIFQSATDSIDRDTPFLHMVHGDCLNTSCLISLLLEHSHLGDKSFSFPNIKFLSESRSGNESIHKP